MSKRIRPSLKDYLRTGEVHTETYESQETVSASPPPSRAQEKRKEDGKKRKTEPKRATQTKERQPRSRKVFEKTGTHARKNALSPLAEGLLAALADTDRATWEPILRAGSEVSELPLDYVSLRETFRTMDRNRFTCYILERKGAALRPVRTSVQIREPLELLLKWDEMGMLTLFRPSPLSA